MLKIKPSKVIGENYLSRWHIIPRNRFFNIYLHKFTGSDDDKALHSHPWASVSILLKGQLAEIMPGDGRVVGGLRTEQCREVNRFAPIFRSRKHWHRLVLLSDEAWTLFITGPRQHFPALRGADGKPVPRWYFLCGDKKIPWFKMTTPTGENIRAQL